MNTVILINNKKNKQECNNTGESKITEMKEAGTRACLLRDAIYVSSRTGKINPRWKKIRIIIVYGQKGVHWKGES